MFSLFLQGFDLFLGFFNIIFDAGINRGQRERIIPIGNGLFVLRLGVLPDAFDVVKKMMPAPGFPQQP